MNSQCDVVIIGAGIQGLSAAYHLTTLGITDVIVVEKEFVGAGSSGRSASMLMMQLDSEEAIRLSQYSYERYMAFKEELGVDPGYHPIGFLMVAPQSKEAQLREHARLRQEMGVDTRVLSPEEIKELIPVVNVEDIRVGVLGPDDGVIDAVAIMQGYAAGARRAGASIRQGTRATGIVVERGRVTGVETTDGLISTPVVVNAAGADAIRVGRWVGIELPIRNLRRSIYITDAFPQIPADSPMVQDAEAEWYYRKEGPGVLMGMGKEESEEIAMTPNMDFLPNLVEFAIHRVPVLADARIMRGWSGIRSLTPDGHAIVGPVEQVEGFVNDCGWGGEGVMHAPAGGRLVAEHIAGSTERTLDPAPFLLSRFDTGGA